MTLEPQIRIERAPMEPPLFGRWKIYIEGEYSGSAATEEKAKEMANKMVGKLKMVGD